MTNFARKPAVVFIALLLVGCNRSNPAPASQQEPPPATTADQEPQHKHTNRLAGETSPYLLQHAHNPVDWYPWGPEAFEKAKRENKPIFLSVGYSTCYWCHVMERESFENEEVAAIINQHFVPIKVDREERPEVDQQYMIATQLISGRGGWPNSVWLTPDGKPWMAGTYFPRERFMQALLQLADVWKNRNPDALAQADSLTEAIEQQGATEAGDQPASATLIEFALSSMKRNFDYSNGGFGSKPKFPPHANLAVLIDQAKRTGDEQLLAMVEKTLVAMDRGGVCDQIGGGFHRYSTDAHWLLPHFEKMLYDNGQLMRSYTDGYLLSKNLAHRETVEGIFVWLQREMTSPDGAFYSALDSESDAEEGKYYVWTHEEILASLGQQDGELFATVYGVLPDGNFKEERSGQESKNNVLHLDLSIEDYSTKNKIDPTELKTRLANSRSKLLSTRSLRSYPHLDDKILSSWNGLMIEGLAYAGRQLNEPKYTEAATRAAKFILGSMIRNGKLQRTWRSGQAKLNGYLDDYAYLAAGLLELYRATGDKQFLDGARSLADTMLADFQDPQNGGFYFTPEEQNDGEDLFVIRSKNLSGGGNLPSGNGVAARVLFDLAELTGNDHYTTAGTRTIDSLSGYLFRTAGEPDELLVATATMLDRKAGPATDDAADSADIAFKSTAVHGKLYASALSAAPGETIRVAVRLTIDVGWHLYGPNPDTNFVSPTTVTFAVENSVTVVDLKVPAGHRKQDPAVGQELETYEGEITFFATLRVPKDAVPGPQSVKLSVRTQACDSTLCAEANTKELELKIEVSKQTSPGDLRYPEIFGPVK